MLLKVHCKAVSLVKRVCDATVQAGLCGTTMPGSKLVVCTCRMELSPDLISACLALEKYLDNANALTERELVRRGEGLPCFHPGVSALKTFKGLMGTGL